MPAIARTDEPGSERQSGDKVGATGRMAHASGDF
jgi:hypothetical protein